MSHSALLMKSLVAVGWDLPGLPSFYYSSFFFVVVVISRFFLFFFESRASSSTGLNCLVAEVACPSCKVWTLRTCHRRKRVLSVYLFMSSHFPYRLLSFWFPPILSLSLSFVRSFYRRTEKSPFGFVLFVVLFSFLFLTSNFFFYFLFLGFFFFFFFVSKPNDDDATWPPVARCPFRLAGEGNRWNLLLFFFPSLISSGTSPLAATEKKNPRNGPKNNGKREILSLPSSSSSSSSSSKFET